MRTATIRLSPPEEGLHPAEREVAARPNVELEVIDHLTGLADGTAVLLCRLRGDRSAVEDALTAATGIVDHHLTAVDRTVYAHVHFEPTETARALLELRRSHELVVETPIRWRFDGRVGDHATLQAAVADLPEALGVELVEIGAYEPAADRAESLLTDRQLEVLDAALAVGYYEEPREGTQADVAEVVGLAPATVGEHLRRIEGKVLRAVRE